MLTENQNIGEIKGVGVKTAELFQKIRVHTIRDLLEHYPRGYDFYTPVKTISEGEEGELLALELVILGRGAVIRSGKRIITHFKASDGTGQIRLTYYNMPYMHAVLKAGSRHVFRGILKKTSGGNLFMEQPGSFRPEDYRKLENTYQPSYLLTKGLKNRQISGAVRKILENLIPEPDFLEPEECREMDLIPESEAIRKIHFPLSPEEIREARKRKIFDEFFYFVLSMRAEAEGIEKLKNPAPMEKVEITEELIGKLPYTLTADQRKVWGEIRDDLSGAYTMNRLLQGDVGSGKTVIAFLSLLMCAANGRQGAMMAPTEVLAAQHMASLEEMIRQYELPLRPALLTGSLTAASKRKLKEKIASGEINAVLGTHALIQDTVRFRNLGLVITDEQHRFGVKQREALAGKGLSVPVLVMSATPIPRTLAIVMYNNVDISSLRTMPGDRLPIKNLVIPAAERGRIFQFACRQIDEGRQVYVICPAIEESDSMEVENVSDYSEKLRQVLPQNIKIASLNGKMKPAEKKAVMDAFSAGETNILVSTTVIEVGINVPNASVMIVENAERFGLSQLHQLRGRVGRGQWQSYCIFIHGGQSRKKPERLNVLERTNDGFAIAEQDLKLRGPGDFFGVRQSGDFNFGLADIYEDSDLMDLAAGYVDKKLQKDPTYCVEQVKSVDFRSI